MAETPGLGHEPSDATVRPIAMFGLGLFVLTVTALLLIGWMFDYFAARQTRLDTPPSPLAETRPLPLEPRLQVNPAQELREMRRAEEALLTSYGWVDQEAGLVRIPIARAMEMLVASGLPVRPDRTKN
jgi:hypothetical protein